MTGTLKLYKHDRRRAIKVVFYRNKEERNNIISIWRKLYKWKFLKMFLHIIPDVTISDRIVLIIRIDTNQELFRGNMKETSRFLGVASNSFSNYIATGATYHERYKIKYLNSN